MSKYGLFRFYRLNICIKFHIGLSLFTHYGFADNYGHWLLEVISKIIYFKNFYKTLSIFEVFIVNKLKYDFQKETLKALNINLDNVVELDNHICYFFDKLYISSYHWWGGYLPPRYLLKEMKKYFSINFNFISHNIYNNIIYISRKKCKNRRVLNEDDLLNRLNDYNIRVLLLEDLSFLQQVELFQNIKIVIGPFGAGLVNIIFSPINSVLIEIRPIIMINEFYKRLALLNDMIYYQIDATPITSHYDDIQYTDWIIDINKISITIKNIINQYI
ncbi:hypothetical protein A946_11705 [Methylacidiphilum kamchatkense Kam1]|nr:glycosyltransferase family 61 protein [Methylacidiphilum kamchatkense]KIE57716.1 hypothetical protein A946_11705 [Methylacidiphilum kamchatkense Kam1]